MYSPDRFGYLALLRLASIMAVLPVGLGSFASIAGPPSVTNTRAHLSASHIIPVAVFGKDSRQKLPAELNSLKQSIGLIYNNREHSVCTAFCVAPNVIATASHCLFRTERERRPALRNFRFVLKAALPRLESPIEGYRTKNPAQFVIAGSRQLHVTPPIDATKDWALMRLHKPICQENFLTFTSFRSQDLLAHNGDGALMQVSFHSDFSDWRLAYSGPCKQVVLAGRINNEQISRDFNSTEDLLLHDCDTGGASSGSPILRRGSDSQLRVIAINVGTYIQTKTLSEAGRIVRRYKSNAIANTAVTAEKILASLSSFAKADIVQSYSYLYALQKALKRQGFYYGQIDGSFGPAMRLAIQNYRGAPNVELAGLPTMELFEKLQPDIDKTQSRKSPGRKARSVLSTEELVEYFNDPAFQR